MSRRRRRFRGRRGTRGARDRISWRFDPSEPTRSVGNVSYPATNVMLRARNSAGGFTVTGTYERTLVWSPPHNDAIAGSRTAEYGVELFFTREGGFELRRDDELRELRTSPAR